MGRKLRIGAAIALVLVAGCVTVASATSSGDNRSSDPDRRKVVVLDFVAQVAGRQEIDEAPTGESLGDWTVLEVDLSAEATRLVRKAASASSPESTRTEPQPLTARGFRLCPVGRSPQSWPSNTGQTKC